jgi:hypothetical protein
MIRSEFLGANDFAVVPRADIGSPIAARRAGLGFFKPQPKPKP